MLDLTSFNFVYIFQISSISDRKKPKCVFSEELICYVYFLYNIQH